MPPNRNLYGTIYSSILILEKFMQYLTRGLFSNTSLVAFWKKIRNCIERLFLWIVRSLVVADYWLTSWSFALQQAGQSYTQSLFFLQPIYFARIFLPIFRIENESVGVLCVDRVVFLCLRPIAWTHLYLYTWTDGACLSLQRLFHFHNYSMLFLQI